MVKVSVVIAVFNGFSTLEHAIESYLAQSYVNKELIIIDGGSTDGTLQILEKYDLCINYWISERDRGIYHAWNKALKQVTGEWICFIGSDDYWAYPDAISHLVDEGTNSRVELVSGKVALVNSFGVIKRYYGKQWSWPSIKRHHVIAHPGMMHHRSCFNRVGQFNEKYKIAGDYDFSLRLGSSTRAAFLDRVFVCMGDSGISHSNIRLALNEVFHIQSQHSEVGYLFAGCNFFKTFCIVAIKKMLGIL